jgi:hypothetical protein
MMEKSKNSDAGSEVAPQSCDQTQSRRTFTIRKNSLKINEINLLRAISALATVSSIATSATDHFPTIITQYTATVGRAAVRNFRTAAPVCANFAHTARTSGGK